jgi:DtxR family Mn-dependent transcriptional regulator
MQRAGLVEVTDGRLILTEAGNRYALQIIRAHRLWERYLADETGVDPERWHVEAEQYEHRLSPDDAEALSARLGHPSFDPHGDPIPTADGELLRRDLPDLSAIAPGEQAQVVHVEDEPDVAYRRILELGIFPGMTIRVVEKTAEGMVCDAGGNRFELPALVARNITVARPGSGVPEVPEIDGTMADMDAGESAEVVRISPACRGAERRRLMDLGIVPGTRVRFERRGISGGLSAYRVRGTTVALRSEQAQMISIRHIEEAA